MADITKKRTNTDGSGDQQLATKK
uniref:Uncharacterized protein n=1 Tax=Anopheles albimanus TaxID=7167 RepID=A0A182FXT6_ANOAL